MSYPFEWGAAKKKRRHAGVALSAHIKNGNSSQGQKGDGEHGRFGPKLNHLYKKTSLEALGTDHHFSSQ